MEVTSLTFNIKDVITIVLGISSLLGLYYAIIKKVEKLEDKVEDQETRYNSDTEKFNASVKELKQEFSVKEQQLEAKISELRAEQKGAHEKLEGKIDSISIALTNLTTKLSELTGYLKGKENQ